MLPRAVSQSWAAPWLGPARRDRPQFGRRLLTRCTPVARWTLALSGGLASFVLEAADARAQPVLHEYIELKGTGELLPGGSRPSKPPFSRLQAPLGSRNAASDQSLTAPEPSADPNRPGEPTVDSHPRFAIDRDTSRPKNTAYSDPFSPTIAPFKRSTVYDAVDRSGTLFVADSSLTPVASRSSATGDQETFVGRFTLELVANQPVALPSVAADSTLRVVQLQPPGGVQIVRDSADNWFALGTVSGPSQLVLQIASSRQFFNADYPDVDFPLEPASQRTPIKVAPEVVAAARGVASSLGLGQDARPQRIVRTLVQHFRAFQPSDTPASGTGLALFRQLALGGKGICRHRAYAFTVLALGLGLPTRYAMNEAHAWVEVFDGRLWHRIDLGGAASELQVGGVSGRPGHVLGPDPYPWSPGSHPGSSASRSSDRNGTTPAPSESKAASSDPSLTPSPAEETAPPSSPSLSPGWSEPRDGTSSPPWEPTEEGRALPERLPQASSPATTAPDPSELPFESATVAEDSPAISLRVRSDRAERGRLVQLHGRVTFRGRPCSQAILDISLAQVGQLATGLSRRAADRPPVSLGQLVADPQGQFTGQLAIPWATLVGDYQVIAKLSADSPDCQQSSGPRSTH